MYTIMIDNDNNNALWCDNASIEYTDCYKKIGVEFTKHLSWAKVIESTSLKASRVASYLITNAIKWCIHIYCLYTLI